MNPRIQSRAKTSRDPGIKNPSTECIFFLTEDKSMVIEEADSSFGLIQLLDRGGLKWPSQLVFAAVCTLWKVFIKIEQSPVLLKDKISNSRSILVQLIHFKN